MEKKRHEFRSRADYMNSESSIIDLISQWVTLFHAELYYDPLIKLAIFA